ncbi:glutamate ABC transporter substrate-binding protein [Yimella sp. cx-51]|uniref:glutamate ABC transporter substrate-binding protein n=1 Tax=Yimella sp. cx-51 TaxID=2770551 RepID=UPI00165E9ECD|nr:glutamate ABC transporter substrate-binding protein [Yimella sp. cx-51]MBC9958247.1 glutamate ABC transporter substrate-binding protein [Yimella sp. cx-51]QTH38725.1 glutamate ABC transporter substrate-binding protein [Yimella sp. cx-51]
MDMTMTVRTPKLERMKAVKRIAPIVAATTLIGCSGGSGVGTQTSRAQNESMLTSAASKSSDDGGSSPRANASELSATDSPMPSASTSASSNPVSSGEPTMTGPTIKIGVKFDQPGLGLKVGSTATGFDVDVATYVAGKLGYAPNQIEFIQVPSRQRENVLQSGMVKMVVATYSITDKRLSVIDMAGPYFNAGQSVLVRTNGPISTASDLVGHTVCSVRGSTAFGKLAQRVPGLTAKEFDTYSACVVALADGSISAMTTDDTILRGYANQSQYRGNFKLIGGTITNERYGIGIKKGDVETCRKINGALRSMVADGSWERFVRKNLGDPALFKAGANPPVDLETCH